jgi:hypothetical protein
VPTRVLFEVSVKAKGGEDDAALTELRKALKIDSKHQDGETKTKAVLEHFAGSSVNVARKAEKFAR